MFRIRLGGANLSQMATDMENIPSNREVIRARRALASTRVRTSERIGSANLNIVGREKPLVPPEAVAKAIAASAVKEYGNGRAKSVKQIEREVVGDSIVLKGKSRAMHTAQSNIGQKKQALKLAPTLTVPIARNSRIANKDGATSFHFKHEAIAKTMHEKVSAEGTKTRKNAGRDHSKYLERDSAVARNGEVIDIASLSEVRIPTAGASGRAAAGGLYIEREEALAHRENGVAVIYSNISQDADERHRFWELVEEHETEPNPDQIEFTTGEAPEFWDAVRADVRCPQQLALAIEEADPSKPYSVQTDDNEYIRHIMADHGWAPPMSRRPQETDDEKNERKRLDRLNSKGARCVDGRGGHIQNRIVGELPYEVSHEQRIRIVRRFADDFEDINLPYVAVMHAPDHANNDKNWHFHLAYYERPCSRFTGEPDDYLEQGPRANKRAEDMHAVKVDAFSSGALKEYVGQWDFTVPVIYKTKCSHTRLTYPFFQDKHRPCNKRNWPLKLRKRLAELINDELEIANVDRRVDPRRFEEMGINKNPEEHLGSRSAQMEHLGIATPQGVENEHRQWQHTLDCIEMKLKQDQRDASNQGRRWHQKLECLELKADAEAEIGSMISIWIQTQSEASELAAIALELEKHYKRAQSRALKVKETCSRHIQAIEDGTANKRQRDNKANYLARLREATDHLWGLRFNMSEEIVSEKQTSEDADRLTEKATRLRKSIEDRLRSEMAIINTGHALPHTNEMKTRGPATDKAPIHVADAVGRENSGVSYQSTTADRNIQTTSTDFSKETPVRSPMEAVSQAGHKGESIEVPSGLPNNARVAFEAPQAPISSPSSQQPAAAASIKPASLTQVMRKIDHIAEERIPIFREIKNGQPSFSLEPYDLYVLGLSDSDIADGDAQVRINQIYQRQESEIKRLVGYILKSPVRAVTSPPTLFSNKRPVVRLDEKSPPELRVLSIKYAQHPVAQEGMHEALHKAIAELEKVKAAEEARRQHTVDERARLNDRAPKDFGNADPTPLSPLSSDTKNGGHAAASTPIRVQPELQGHESNRRDDKILAVSPEPQPKMPSASEPTSVKPAADAHAAGEPPPYEALRQVVSAPTLTAEERAELLGPRIFGMNGGSRLAPRLRQHQLEADKPPWQQIAALALKNDRKALVAALDVLDPRTQARIRRDWEAQQAKDRANIEAIRQQAADQSLLPK